MKTLLISRVDGLTDEAEGTFGAAMLLDTSGNRVPCLDGTTPTWCSLELPWRNNAPGVSRIPAGIYKAVLEYSPHFSRVLFHLLDVPGRSYVEVHAANWAGDVAKGFYSDLEGCISIGMHLAVLTPPRTGHPQKAIAQSGFALDQLMSTVGNDDFRIDVRDPVQS